MNPALNGASFDCSPLVLIAPGNPPLDGPMLLSPSSLRCHCCTRITGTANLVVTPFAIRATLLALLLVTAYVDCNQVACKTEVIRITIVCKISRWAIKEKSHYPGESRCCNRRGAGSRRGSRRGHHRSYRRGARRHGRP